MSLLSSVISVSWYFLFTIGMLQCLPWWCSKHRFLEKMMWRSLWGNTTAGARHPSWIWQSGLRPGRTKTVLEVQARLGAMLYYSINRNDSYSLARSTASTARSKLRFWRPERCSQYLGELSHPQEDRPRFHTHGAKPDSSCSSCRLWWWQWWKHLSSSLHGTIVKLIWINVIWQCSLYAYLDFVAMIWKIQQILAHGSHQEITSQLIVLGHRPWYAVQDTSWSPIPTPRYHPCHPCSVLVQANMSPSAEVFYPPPVI